MYLSRRESLALVCLLVLTSLGAGVFFWRRAMRGEVVVEAPPAVTAEEADRTCVVHVCGAVKNPGVYKFPMGTRVYEALAAAGGTLPEADQEALNLAAFIQDGEQIFVPRRGEAPRPKTGDTSSRVVPTGRTAEPSFPLNLNRASAAELEAVPGIGPALAARIVAYRATNGPFATVEDLLNVPGIGEKTLGRLAPYLTAP